MRAGGVINCRKLLDVIYGLPLRLWKCKKSRKSYRNTEMYQYMSKIYWNFWKSMIPVKNSGIFLTFLTHSMAQKSKIDDFGQKWALKMVKNNKNYTKIYRYFWLSTDFWPFNSYPKCTEIFVFRFSAFRYIFLKKLRIPKLLPIRMTLLGISICIMDGSGGGVS